jgi:methyltransferase-like protein/cyclopropane fatty-acyl-phospholipid synthase-like methyltransferase
MTDSTTNNYDEFPYTCHAYPSSHPDRMSVIARLFGMTPAPLANARVLELGCGNGANLIPMAAQMPDARFVGLDLSPRQIADGRAQIAELGLANIELNVADIAKVGPSLPVFDFIIAHGVYSWVPPPVQDALLRICAEHLSAQGVAYVSYNTYPGWRTRGTIRDFMLYHARQFPDPKVQVQQARAVLDFIAQGTPNENSAYARQLKDEVEVLRKQSDAYLFHDFLEDVNIPVYFHQFVAHAGAHGLQYLGESEFTTMLPQNFPQAVVATLQRIAPDLVRAEQFMDFLRNRPFRQTLLVHRDLALTRQVDWQPLTTMEIGTPARPPAFPVDERSDAKVQFATPAGVSAQLGTPITKAAMSMLALRWPQTMPFAELCAGARARLGGDAASNAATAAQDAATLGPELLRLAGAGIVELRIGHPQFTLQVREKPAVYALARRNAKDGPAVTNLRHEAVLLDEFNRHVVLLADGTRDRAALIDELARLVASGALAIKQQEKDVTDPAAVRAVMTQALDSNLGGLARAALFPE